mgnify:CR=1 FL=1
MDSKGELAVQFREKGKGTGGICGEEGVCLGSRAEDVVVDGGKDLFILRGIVVGR